MGKNTKKKAKKKAKKTDRPSLTPLQKKFCDIILLMEVSGDVNQQKAYEMAGYKCRGKTAKTEASRTLSKPPLKAYLRRARAGAKRAVEKTKAEIIAQLEKLGFSELTDFVAWGKNGVKIKPSKDIPNNKKAALKSITIDEHKYTNKKGKKGIARQVKLELHSPKGALDSLAKIKGMVKQVITGEDGGPIPVNIIDYSKVDLDSIKPEDKNEQA